MHTRCNYPIYNMITRQFGQVKAAKFDWTDFIPGMELSKATYTWGQ